MITYDELSSYTDQLGVDDENSTSHSVDTASSVEGLTCAAATMRSAIWQ